LTSAVQICSNALLLLGDNPIDSFDVDNNRTRLVANLYESKRDKVLRSHPWNCATKRVTLSPSAEAPAFDWAYQFPLPSDWLRTLSVGLEGDSMITGSKVAPPMDSNTCATSGVTM
jgi:hypothetical protein